MPEGGKQVDVYLTADGKSPFASWFDRLRDRKASSKSGSADVLEKLGVKLEVSADKLRECLASANICFAFARSHHPAMKFVGPARSSLGIPTIFNLLGPLTNPARAKHQLLGVFSPELTDRLATVLRELGSERAWVVHADDGLDELSTLGATRVIVPVTGDDGASDM